MGIHGNVCLGTLQALSYCTARMIQIYLLNMCLKPGHQHPKASHSRFLQQPTTNLYCASVEDMRLRLKVLIGGGNKHVNDKAKGIMGLRTEGQGPS